MYNFKDFTGNFYYVGERIAKDTGHEPQVFHHFFKTAFAWSGLVNRPSLMYIFTDCFSPGANLFFNNLFFKLCKPDVELSGLDFKIGETDEFVRLIRLFDKSEGLEGSEKVILISHIDGVFQIQEKEKRISSKNRLFSFLLGLGGEEQKKNSYNIIGHLIIIRTDLPMDVFLRQFMSKLNLQIQDTIKGNILSLRQSSSLGIIRGIRADLSLEFKRILKFNKMPIVDTTAEFDRLILKAIELGCRQDFLMGILIDKFDFLIWLIIKEIKVPYVQLDFSLELTQNEVKNIIESWGKNQPYTPFGVLTIFRTILLSSLR